MLFSKLRARLAERRKKLNEIVKTLESKGVAPRTARKLASFVASGEYTVDEVLEAYRSIKGRRIRSLESSLLSGGKSLEVGTIEERLWRSIGLGGKSQKRRKGR